MRLGTLRRSAGSRSASVAVRVDSDDIVDIVGFADLGVLLAHPGWKQIARAADGGRRPVREVAPTEWAPLIPAPSKIICVGLNYRAHILEMGRELPRYPTLFAKYPEALIGPYDTLVLPPEAAAAVDWEGELAVVLGAPARRLDEATALAAIAGYSVLNDITMRDYQYRSPEWLAGKTFEGTTPFGPYLVTADEFALGASLMTTLDGEVVQHAHTDDLVFSPAQLVSYISHILTLNPGDVIATGTPGGVGHARTPPRYLAPGATLRTAIEGLGELVTPVVAA